MGDDGCRRRYVEMEDGDSAKSPVIQLKVPKLGSTGAWVTQISSPAPALPFAAALNPVWLVVRVVRRGRVVLQLSHLDGFIWSWKVHAANQKNAASDCIDDRRWWLREIPASMERNPCNDRSGSDGAGWMMLCMCGEICQIDGQVVVRCSTKGGCWLDILERERLPLCPSTVALLRTLFPFLSPFYPPPPLRQDDHAG